jgi:hypothetical protein
MRDVAINTAVRRAKPLRLANASQLSCAALLPRNRRWQRHRRLHEALQRRATQPRRVSFCCLLASAFAFDAWIRSSHMGGPGWRTSLDDHRILNGASRAGGEDSVFVPQAPHLCALAPEASLQVGSEPLPPAVASSSCASA